MENLEKMWFIANATAKRDLIDEGVPLIAVIFKGLSDSRKFFSVQGSWRPHSTAECFLLSGVAEEAKLRAISTCLDAPFHLPDRQARASSFRHVLLTVKLNKLSATLIVGFTSIQSDFAFLRECRQMTLSLAGDGALINMDAHCLNLE